MKTVEIAFKPGDVVQYYSSRYGTTEMEITEVKLFWNKYNFTIKYLGYPKYPNRKRYFRQKTAISKLNNITLLKEK